MQPAVVEKVMVDIDAWRGIDESMSPEDMNWTKGLVDCTNLVVDDSSLKVRPGTNTVDTFSQPLGTTAASPNVCRLGSSYGTAVAVGGKGYTLSVLDRASNNIGTITTIGGGGNDGLQFSNRRVSEFRPKHWMVGSDYLSNREDFPDALSGVTGSAITSKYVIIAHTVRVPSGGAVSADATPRPCSTLIEFVDRNSGTTVHTYYVANENVVGEGGIDEANVLATIVAVADRYVHVYISSLSASPKIDIIDTNDFSTEGVTTIPNTASGDVVAGAVAYESGSLAITSSSKASYSGNPNEWIHKYTSVGAHSASSELTAFQRVTGIDYNGTDIFISGVKDEEAVFNPATLNLTVWNRASFASSPWNGVASAGTSGNWKFVEATNPPGVGAAQNGLDPINLDGFNDTLRLQDTATSTNQAVSTIIDADGWTVLVLLRPDTASAPGVNPYNSSNVIGDGAGSGNWGVTYTTSGITAYQNTAGGYRTSSTALSTGSYALGKLRYDGTNLQSGVNNGSMSSTASGNVSTLTGTPVRIGDISGGSGDASAYDGRILEVMVADYSMSDSEIENVGRYMQDRYNLDLGFTAFERPKYRVSKLALSNLAVSASSDWDPVDDNIQPPDGDDAGDEYAFSHLRVAAFPASDSVELLAWTRNTAINQNIPMVYWYTQEDVGTGSPSLSRSASMREGSQPVYNPATGRVYVVGVLGNSADTNDPQASVTLADDVLLVTAVGSLGAQKFRAACNVASKYNPSLNGTYEPSGAGSAFLNGYSQPQRVHCTSDGTMCLGNSYTYQPNQRAFEIATLTPYDPTCLSFANKDIGGGTLASFDGSQVVETGFFGKPFVEIDSSSGTGVNGTYRWVAVWGFQDQAGRTHYSRTSEIVSATGSPLGTTYTLWVTVPVVTSKYLNSFILLYRTAANGADYYLVDTIPAYVNTNEDDDSYRKIAISYVDNISNTDIVSKPIFYRQPGQPNGPLDRYPGLSSEHLIRHKDRIFYCRGENIYYSSFEVDGEAPWFNPAFVIRVPGGHGDITGLASMDGTLIAFKRDSVFIIDGDGPPENGGSGNEFSTPRQIRCEFGCVDQRSIVSTPNGILYMSARGIEMIDRGLQNVFVGKKVQRTVETYPRCTGAAFDRAEGRAMFCLHTSTTNGIAPVVASTNSIILVYDTTGDVWTIQKDYDHNDEGEQRPTQDVCYVEGEYNGLSGKTFFGWSNYLYERTTSNLDDGAEFVPWSLTTGWARGNSKQDRILVSDMLLLGRRSSSHQVKGSFRINYKSSAFTEVETFDHTETDIDPEQLEFNPTTQSCESMQWKLEGVEPGASVGNGSQLDILGITVRLGAKTGGQKLAAAAKG